MKDGYGIFNPDWEVRLVEPEGEVTTLGDEKLRLEAEMDRIRSEVRAAVEPAPRWARWLMAKIWPRIFA
jgi:hypothetical protein